MVVLLSLLWDREAGMSTEIGGAIPWFLKFNEVQGSVFLCLKTNLI